MSVTPDLFLIVAVYGGLRARRDRAMLLGWAAGLCKDLFCVSPLGLHALLFLLAAFGLTQMRRYLFHRRWSVRFVLVFAVSFACNGVYAIGLLISEPQIGLSVAAVRTTYVSLYTAVASLPLLWVLWRLGRWLGVEHGLRFGPAA